MDCTMPLSAFAPGTPKTGSLIDVANQSVITLVDTTWAGGSCQTLIGSDQIARFVGNKMGWLKKPDGR